ncbi:hypothetical protein HMN09_00079500 [Mycena chlorophos]|uniref:Uncharacterized protein n=1 Tax=Mycena chlorophos TaxID=658473 RepID=A0A8H6WQ52_MYCCL|nr:hypothetical protein HMN09_00079500 [Mycena chlorophos]
MRSCVADESENLVSASPRTSVVSECTLKASLLTSSPAASPQLLLTPTAIQLDSPQLRPSLLESPQQQQQPAGLGKRRGFKGAPLALATPEIDKRSSFLSTATKSPSTPRVPSTPRTPLQAVTNLIRTPTPLKSPVPPKSPVRPEIPIPPELQQIYWAADPFSVLSESYYDPEVCGAVPFSSLARIDGYYIWKHGTFSKAMDSACTTTPKLWATLVYDAMVYNFQPPRAPRPKIRRAQNKVPRKNFKAVSGKENVGEIAVEGGLSCGST